MANPSNIPKTSRDVRKTNGSILFFDRSGPTGSNTFEAKAYIDGDLSGNFGAKAEKIRVYVRGVQIATRTGNNPQLEGSMSTPLFQFTNGSQDVLLDVCDGTGNIGATWTKHTETVDQWNVGMRITKDGGTDAANHSVTVPAVIIEWDFAEADNGEDVISLSWSCEDYATYEAGGIYGKSGPT